MLTEEEKNRIVERVQFEAQIRKDIQPAATDDNKPSKLRWLDSKLGILLIGSLLTGVLVPVFQYTQETIKWKRQNRYENVKYRLGMMRDGMKEFVFVHAFNAEAYERIRPFAESQVVQKKDFETYFSQHVEMQNRRFQQNAKFASLLIYFPEKDRANLRETYNDYLTSVQTYMGKLERTVQIRYALSQSPRPDQKEVLQLEFQELIQSLDSLLEVINQKYDGVLQIMKEQIGGREDESESYM
ncbi:MAG TPA: hypothetical protein VFH15_09825 [Pyrinomonadaceae bacterium]|nr:hypothetical protein [Pyrinomonadaceae bacterium]